MSSEPDPAQGPRHRRDQEQSEGGRLATALRLALRSLLTGGRAYPELADHLAGDIRAFLQARVPLAGASVLDLGSGHGSSSSALGEAGAHVVSTDRRPRGGTARVAADAMRLPFRDGSFDGAVCSNMLEHVSSPPAVVRELARVLRSGGWLYLSWTAWYGPLGGHEYSPWHLLGVRPARAIGRHVRLGAGHNVPGEALFPVLVGPTIDGIASTGLFDVQFAGPRYWPSQTWIVRTRLLREIATWNCLLFLRRR